MRRPQGRDVAEPDASSVAGAVAQFALTGLVVLALFLVGSVLLFRNLGRSEALRDARQFAVLTGQGIVEPALEVVAEQLVNDRHSRAMRL